MFAYCRNDPVTRVDFSGAWDVDCFDSDGNPITDEKEQWFRSSTGAGVSSSYYASQNVKNYDSWWRNSEYNPNMTWSCGATAQQAASDDAFNSFIENPKSIKGKTESDISKALGDAWKRGKYGSQGNGWKFTNGDKLIAYHPGGGRHVGSYYKLSSAEYGKTKIVGADYVPIQGDKAMIIWCE